MRSSIGLFWIAAPGFLIHAIAAQSLGGAVALGVSLVILLAIVPLSLSFTVWDHRRQFSRDFVLFFSVYYLAGALARLRAEVTNPEAEIYQNESDAQTLFELASMPTLMDSEELLLVTDTGGAIKTFWLLYKLIHLLSLPTPAGIGVTLNAVLVGGGSALAMVGASRVFGSHAPAHVVARWMFATSGVAFLFAGLHLRDSFLYLLNSALLLVLLRADPRRFVTSVIPAGLLGAALVFAMTWYRAESSFIWVGFCAALLIEVAFASGRGVRILMLTVVGVAGGASVAFLLGSGAELIALTRSSYREAQSETGGLAAHLIVNVPAVVRVVVGPVYMILGHIPFFVSVLMDEWYHWFVGIQAAQALVVLPAFCWTVAGFMGLVDPTPPEILRRVLVFYLFMALVVSLSTVSVRHLGQFLPCLYLLAAFGVVVSSSMYRLATGLAIAVFLPVVWLQLKV